MASWIFGSWLAWRLLGPEFSVRSRAPQTRPLHIAGRTVFVGDREFFVREVGPLHAPAIVLLHGWSFDGEMTYFNVIPELADRYRVIIPDNRGHGRSEWIRERHDVADIADDVAGVLDAIHVKDALVFGYSMGGMVAQELARRRPDLVSRLMLAATAASPAIKRPKLFRASIFFGRTMTRISKKEFSTISTFAMRRSDALDPEYTRWMWEGLMRRDPTLYYYTGDAMSRFDSRLWVGELAMPVKILVTTNDQLMPVSEQRNLASFFPRESVVDIEGGRHESIMNRADEYVKRIIEFQES